MVPLVLLHVAVIFYATHKGLTAHDILARTRGSLTWAALYCAFVVAPKVDKFRKTFADRVRPA